MRDSVRTESSSEQSEFSIEEVRDWFWCPFIWWLRRQGLALEQEHRLQRLTGHPAAASPRTLPYEVSRLGPGGSLIIAGIVSA
ncbi:MAG: hypothetical protein ABIK43_03885, partial [candidate division WOR-3 bacterium]